MKAVLFIEIADEIVYVYDKPILGYVRQHFPETIVFDFDNRSEASTAAYAIKIVEEAKKTAIILQLREGNTGALLPFFEKVIHVKEKCLVFVNGNNRMIERMLSALDESQIRRKLSEAVQQEEISSFLSASDL